MIEGQWFLNWYCSILAGPVHHCMTICIACNHENSPLSHFFDLHVKNLMNKQKLAWPFARPFKFPSCHPLPYSSRLRDSEPIQMLNYARKDCSNTVSPNPPKTPLGSFLERTSSAIPASPVAEQSLHSRVVGVVRGCLLKTSFAFR